MSDSLIRRIQANRELRERVKRREQDYNSHVRTVRDAAQTTTLDFWCKHCNRDFTTTAYKREGWVGAWPTAWYVGRCRCGRCAIRRITDKSKDTFFRDSKNIRFQRVRNYNDMLTPADDLFKVIYPKEYERITRNGSEGESEE